ncbi:hypothetical protein CR513_46346, partial [Mucuna pruriens]
VQTLPRHLEGVAMQWFADLPSKITHTLNELAMMFGLRGEQFSDSLALRRPSSMGEIRARAEKHIEAKENQVDQIQAKRTPQHSRARVTTHILQRRITNRWDEHRSFEKSTTHNYSTSHHLLAEGWGH